MSPLDSLVVILTASPDFAIKYVGYYLLSPPV